LEKVGYNFLSDFTFINNLLESLDELADLAATLFSPIPNRGRDALPMINEHPFGPDQKGVSAAIFALP